MYGGVGGKANLALVLAVGLSIWTTQASAADLGGDCCGDLEERIAELEATAARKGNRKVSLEVSGHINEAVLWWDDGAESNAYIVTNDNSRTRFRFKGKAKIDKDWEAGYQIEVGVRTANSKRANQLNPKGNDFAPDAGLDLRDSYWYIKSKTYGGSRWVGRLRRLTRSPRSTSRRRPHSRSTPTSRIRGLGMLLRSATDGQLTNNGVGATGQTGLTWRRLIGDGGDQPGEGERKFNLVKYVSPEFSGFVASASWGEDDFWDVALNYEGEFGGFKVAAGIGYGEITDGLQTNTVCNASGAVGANDTSCRQFGGSISVIHEKIGPVRQLRRAASEDRRTYRADRALCGHRCRRRPDSSGRRRPVSRRSSTISARPPSTASITTTTAVVIAGARSLPPIRSTRRMPAPGLCGTRACRSTVRASRRASIRPPWSSTFLYRHVEGDLTLRQIGAGGVANGIIRDAPIDDLDLVMSGAIIKF